MMKQVKITMPRRVVTLACGLALAATAFGQQVVVKGHVVDATGEPVIGATVRVAGQQGGTVTDIDGNFSLKAKPGEKVTIDYIGYDPYQGTASPNMNVTLHEGSAKALNEVVVIGYGAVKKSDLTGSVTALKPDSKNKGLVVSAQDLMQGKIAGVNVTNNGGTPGGGATIRIRGGSSLNASNDPLIVIDGVPMDNNGVKDLANPQSMNNNGVKGLANPLSMINPQDIESFNVLKDASATAIYGSRGSNGVIIITTKKGHKGQKMSLSYSGSVAMSMKRKNIDVMDGDEYREFVKRIYKGNDNEAQAVAALGQANTNWQNEIYRTAVTHDHNVTLTGSVGKVLPYRVSLGYTSEQGILKTSDMDRYTAAINLNPSLLDNHLNINVNLKGMYADSHYADGEAIGAAVWFDPSQSVYDFTSADHANFGNYFEWKANGKTLDDPTWPHTYETLATKNPMAILDLKYDRAHSKSFIGNVDFDYKVHGFEDLRLHATLGADISQGKQLTDVAPASPLNIYYGNHGWEKMLKRNLSLSAYAQYYHDFKDNAKNHFDIMAGYEWQHFWRKLDNAYWGYYAETNNNKALAGKEFNHRDYRFATENYLVSFFGRANWSLMDRYYVTATVRDDGSSRFKEHWAWFPSFAFAWKMKDENKLRDVKWLSDLKMRLGWGMTGQQEGIGDYNYFTIYQMNVGSESFYPVYNDGKLARPQAVNKELTWETTTTYNVGLDFGFFKQRLSGSVDWYYRKTDNLLNTVYVSAGSNFKNQVPSNIGSLTNSGVEVSLNWRAIQAKDWYWTLDYNFTYNKNKITALTGGNDSNYFIPTGGISAGTGANAQAHSVGHPANSYYVYQQVYDQNGMPLENVVVDRNADGVINEADKYLYKNPMPPVTMGLSSRLEYKTWDFSFTLRANIGNYVFNDLMASASNISTSQILAPAKYLTNRPVDVLPYNWQTNETFAILSDRWVQNASFLKCDNITLGYSFENLFKGSGNKGINGRVYATATNVFVLTKYKGIDPEVFSGIDRNLYPRPISFMLGLNLTF